MDRLSLANRPNVLQPASSRTSQSIVPAGDDGWEAVQSAGFPFVLCSSHHVRNKTDLQMRHRPNITTPAASSRALQRGTARATKTPRESLTELVGMAQGAPAQPLASVTMPVPQRRCKTLQGGLPSYAATMIGHMSLLCNIQHDPPAWVSSILDK
jgi:hypothetical protein